MAKIELPVGLAEKLLEEIEEFLCSTDAGEQAAEIADMLEVVKGLATATLVAHDTALPVASHGFHDKSGERAAIGALLEEVSLAGHVITVDAPHTVRDTARSIVESHNADYLMTVKANAPETYETLGTIEWNRDATGAFEEEPTKGHGRIERRRIQTMTPLRGTVNFPHIAQIFRIERDRETCKSGKKSTEIAYSITSVTEDRGTPENLLA